MAKLVLVNPRKRTRKASSRKARKSSRRARARNPITTAAVKRHVRRRSANPHRRTTRARRRRNPISMRSLSANTFITMLTDAAIGGAGAVGMDVVMAQVNKYLPPSLQPTPGSVGGNDVVRFALTVVLGHFGSKFTKGVSRKAAAGALAVQAADLGRAMLMRASPATATAAGVGYASPARIIPGTARLNPNPRMSAYSRGASPLLNAYSSGATSLLASRNNMSPRMRDAVRR